MGENRFKLLCDRLRLGQDPSSLVAHILDEYERTSEMFSMLDQRLALDNTASLI